MFPGRVVWRFNPKCCEWDGSTGFWWNSTITHQNVVDSMLNSVLGALTNTRGTAEAWDLLFRHHNQRHGFGPAPYMRGEKVAVKINLNNEFGTYESVNYNGLSPQFLRSVVMSLVKFGVAPQDLSIYDASRWFADFYYDAVHGDFPAVHLIDNQGQQGREKVQPAPVSTLVFSSDEVPAHNETFLPTCATEAKYFIVIDNVRGHDLAGVTLTGKNFFGTIYRPGAPHRCLDAGAWCPQSLHDFVAVENRPMATYTPLVDLLGHPTLGGNAVVFLADGLYSGPTEQRDPPVRFESTPFNGHWASSLFASQDPIALDSVLYDILRNEPVIPWARRGCTDNYLHEGALAGNPPSGTRYAPTNDGTPLQSLGVHEHWNNAQEKKYSRNLRTGQGIELVFLPSGDW